jgi:hypothetical protein
MNSKILVTITTLSIDIIEIIHNPVNNDNNNNNTQRKMQQ